MGFGPREPIGQYGFFDAYDRGLIKLENLPHDALCLSVNTIFKFALRPFCAGHPIWRNTILAVGSRYSVKFSSRCSTALCEVHSA
jgi:hypothetical protein